MEIALSAAELTAIVGGFGILWRSIPAFVAALEGISKAVVEAADAVAAVRSGGGDDDTEALRMRVAELEELVDRLPAKWEEIKREANSFYSRATHHARRAQKELQARGYEDPELDDMVGPIHAVDARGSADEGMPAVHTDVAHRQEGGGLSDEAAVFAYKHGMN